MVPVLEIGLITGVVSCRNLLGRRDVVLQYPPWRKSRTLETKE